MIPIARPMSTRPPNGEFFDFEWKRAGSTVHGTFGSISVRFARSPAAILKAGSPTMARGFVENFRTSYSIVSHFASTSSVIDNPMAVSRPTMPKGAVVYSTSFSSIVCGA
jgi:hypothetical protein